MKIIPLIFFAALFCHAMDPALEARVRAAWTPEAAQSLTGLIGEAAKEGLPTGPLEAKVLEGLAKNVPAGKVLQAVSARKALLMEARRNGKAKSEKELNRKVYASERKATVERTQEKENERTMAPPVPDHPAITGMKGPAPTAGEHQEARHENKMHLPAREEKAAAMEEREKEIRTEKREDHETRKEESRELKAAQEKPEETGPARQEPEPAKEALKEREKPDRKEADVEKEQKRDRKERIMEMKEKREEKAEHRKMRERKGM
jgi:hypothetical protein